MLIEANWRLLYPEVRHRRTTKPKPAKGWEKNELSSKPVMAPTTVKSFCNQISNNCQTIDPIPKSKKAGINEFVRNNLKTTMPGGFI